MTAMNKALTVKQPWAWAIVAAGKDVENRSWATKYRGPVMIHAGRAADPDALDFPAMRAALGEESPALPAGFVVGQAALVGCHHADWCWDDGAHCSPWAMEGAYHWQLDNRVMFDEPFAAKGKLGLWSLGSDEVPPLISALTDPEGLELVAGIHERLAARRAQA